MARMNKAKKAEDEKLAAIEEKKKVEVMEQRIRDRENGEY